MHESARIIPDDSKLRVMAVNTQGQSHQLAVMADPLLAVMAFFWVLFSRCRNCAMYFFTQELEVIWF